MKYIYGLVKSRRLGLSLGLSLVPKKTCSFDCIYCQLGKTTLATCERKEYVPIQEILDELKAWFENNSTESGGLDFITLSGSGEPTLNIKISQLIKEIKRITNSKVAVITNASLLSDASLRQDLREADVILPSLDAATQELFRKIDNPCQDIRIEEVIEGLVSLRKEFSGQIWLEVMLIKGVNDDLRHIKKLKKIIDRVNPDRVQLNSPVRFTVCPDILPVGKTKLQKIKEILGDRCEII